MLEDPAAIKEAIVAYIRQHGRTPNFASIPTAWDLGQAAFRELRANGTLREVEYLSPSGRRMKKLVVAADSPE